NHTDLHRRHFPAGCEATEISADFAKNKLRLHEIAPNVVQLPSYYAGAVNDNLPTGKKYDRLHGGYMMSEKNAKKYAMNNLNPDGIAVLNVGDTSGYEYALQISTLDVWKEWNL
ncbi:unnamed protein product, partial [Amoebophrya sp. A120]